MKHFCDHCKKDYSSYKTLWIHNKKFHQNTEIVNNIKPRNFECKYCNKKFTTKQNMLQHIGNTCKLVDKETVKLEKQIELLQKEIKGFKSSSITNNNTNNSNNNTNNGTINNIIVINKIGTENISDLNDNEISEIFDKKIESVIKFIQHLHRYYIQ
jgi:hypothetical protein